MVPLIPFSPLAAAHPPYTMPSDAQIRRPATTPPTEIADPWEYAGISAFDSFGGGVRKAVDLRGRLGWYITRIRVPEGAGAVGRCSPRTGHCTLGAPPG